MKDIEEKMTDKLKACPLCGSKARFKRGLVIDLIRCEKCGTKGGSNYEV